MDATKRCSCLLASCLHNAWESNEQKHQEELTWQKYFPPAPCSIIDITFALTFHELSPLK